MKSGYIRIGHLELKVAVPAYTAQVSDSLDSILVLASLLNYKVQYIEYLGNLKHNKNSSISIKFSKAGSTLEDLPQQSFTTHSILTFYLNEYNDIDTIALQFANKQNPQLGNTTVGLLGPLKELEKTLE